MKASPQIHAIYIASQAGESMTQLTQAEIVAGEGIVGDRYALGIGAFSKTKPKIRHVSLVALSAIESANNELLAKQQVVFDPGDTRRNITISGISEDELNGLVGKTFYLGGLTFKGTELCEPCQRPANLLKRPDFMNAFEGRGGLRAEALESGYLTLGSALLFSAPEEN
ncbi:MAG: sulfurase [Polynucleobacter sp. 24-46-87]|jgi:MOSC domain-containing protein YiiM|uniref:MOSC domain-containing protein n=1 Tax=unclassified Polynucleobacter TaxID=2640945 RepID=UPI000BC865DA|nr:MULTISPECIES: MOSC domain-containing protein [unclassified Polynucleobacter]OYY14685.1 MAG: sulfurase [Polynucleobacter sp. 35-46-11]OZA13409.1 MAG: sulfurase [Polynucleobacter sp. 24-46-87]OZA75614.1 MAG: sulfurase [Polynucleobacter sp. 39-46-10]